MFKYNLPSFGFWLRLRTKNITINVTMHNKTKPPTVPPTTAPMLICWSSIENIQIISKVFNNQMKWNN
jgi:hypothetical protein